MRQISRKTLSEQIHDMLREEILTQEIPCGEKLTIRQLQQRFGTSSTPVRDAMVRLAQDGLLDQVSNVGARVVVLTERDIREIYSLCEILDVAALEGAAGGANAAAFLDALRACLACQEAALGKGELADFHHHSDHFHALFYEHAGNRRLAEAAEQIRGQLSILTHRYQNLQRASEIVLDEHRQLVRVLAGQTPGLAGELLRRHIRHGMAFLLEGLESGQA